MLVPMYTEYGDTRLVLLSVTYRAGIFLRDYLQEQPDWVRSQLGGPEIIMDGQPPANMYTVEDLQAMLMQAMGL